MTFEQMLGYGYVVAADDFLNAIVVWNGKGTFDVYTEDSYAVSFCLGSFYCVP